MLPVAAFLDYCEQNALFGPGSNILAAVSGGMDSVLMVHFLKAAGLKFGIAHCNFQLRGDEALRDQEFCKYLAESLQVPFHTINFDTYQHAANNKISIQMAARELRYQWFNTLSNEFSYQPIALAHHQNDAIETILLNLVRGTGIAGLHGILPKNGNLVRPLLFLKREEIAEIIDEYKLAYVEDSSNSSVKYARNKLRAEVIPKLKELNPSLEKTFENNLKHFRELEILLNSTVAKLKRSLFQHSNDETFLLIDDVKALHPARLLLFKLLQEYGFNETTVDDVLSVMNKHPGRIFESPGYIMVLDREKLVISKKNLVSQGEVTITNTSHEVNYGKFKMNILHDDSPLVIRGNPMAASIDAALLQYPLKIRPWLEGDYFYPLGMTGRKKLSDYFVNQKIPLHQKEDIPILINGNGEIIWVAGYRPDERYKVSDNTKKVTIFELYIS